MNKSMFQPHKLKGKLYPSIVVSNEVILKMTPIIMIIKPLVNIPFLNTLSGILPCFFRMLNTTLRADKNTKREGPKISIKAKATP